MTVLNNKFLETLDEAMKGLGAWGASDMLDSMRDETDEHIAVAYKNMSVLDQIGSYAKRQQEQIDRIEALNKSILNEVRKLSEKINKEARA